MTVRLLVSGRARVGVTCLLGAVLFLTSPPPPLLVSSHTMAEAAATAAAAALDVDDEHSKKANIVAARAYVLHGFGLPAMTSTFASP